VLLAYVTNRTYAKITRRLDLSISNKMPRTPRFGRAIDAAGNVIGNALKLTKESQTDAGYSIDTTEIGGAQKVGSWVSA
jgi:hypothetical protein